MKPQVLTTHISIENLGDIIKYNYPLEGTVIQSVYLYCHERGQLGPNIHLLIQQIFMIC